MVQRATITSTIGAVALLGLAVPAHAQATAEGGTKSCRVGEYPGVQLKGQDYDLWTMPPGRGYLEYQASSWSWKTVREGWGGATGGYWEGRVVGPEPRIGNRETYGYCGN